MFAKFTDEWVEDSLMINSLTSNGCSCCSFPSINQSINQLITECTDIDTDGRDAAFNQSINQTIWPVEITESIWADRVKFRKLMKIQSKQFQSMLQSNSTSNNQSISFIDFIHHSIDQNIHQTVDCFTFKTAQLHAHLKSFGFENAYLSLLHLLLNQIICFEQTLIDYQLEGATSPEIAFAEAIMPDETDSTILMIDPAYIDFQKGKLLIDRLCESSGHILPKIKQSNQPEQEQDESKQTDSIDHQHQQGRSVSFRNDRRLLRLFIFRLGIERLFDEFKYSSK